MVVGTATAITSLRPSTAPQHPALRFQAKNVVVGVVLLPTAAVVAVAVVDDSNEAETPPFAADGRRVVGDVRSNSERGDKQASSPFLSGAVVFHATVAAVAVAVIIAAAVAVPLLLSLWLRLVLRLALLLALLLVSLLSPRSLLCPPFCRLSCSRSSRQPHRRRWSSFLPTTRSQRSPPPQRAALAVALGAVARW